MAKANREENLKKINEELEKLDDEQLEKIAGGSWLECGIPMPNNPMKPQPNEVWVK